MHLAASIAANKHIFCEKPIATDGPGVRWVLDSTEKAKEKKLRWWRASAGDITT